MNWCKITLGNVSGISRQMNNGITFLLVLKGSIELENNGQCYSLGKNDVVVLNHGDLFSISGKRENGLLFINISRDYFIQHLPGYLSGSFQCNSRDSASESEQLFDPIKKNIARLAFLYYKRESRYELLFQSVLFETLHMLAKDFFNDNDYSKNQDNSDQRLRSVLAFIHQNYKNRISLEETAAREFMSVQYLSRLFKEHLGSTFMEYLNSLRITNAEQDILYSTNTLSRIAHDNGFASAKALNAKFIKKYNCSPTEYRKANSLHESLNPIDNMQLMEDNNNDSMSALVKFIQTHNLETPDNVDSNHTINLSDSAFSPLPDFQNIVDIGDITRILRADVRKQLEEAQKQQLNLSAVSFGGFFRIIQAMESDPMYFRLYDISEIFETFQSLRLTPIIRLETADMDVFENIEVSLKSLQKLLNMLGRRYHCDFFKQWRFEVLANTETSDRYEKIYRIIKSVDPFLQVGLRIDPFLKQECGKLNELTNNAPPDFFGFTFDPNEETPPNDPIAFALFFKEYHLHVVESIRQYTEAARRSSAPLYMMQWNTLNGKTRVEAGEFHRTALLMDVLLSLMGKIAGAAVRLNLLSDNNEQISLATHALSLYVHKDIRRPMFLVFKSLASLNSQIVWQNESGFLTTDSEDRYSLLLYNACYINPFNALDNIRNQGNILDCSVLLQGLSPGRYRIKKYLLDKDSGSLYNSWLNFDFSIPPEDEDIAEYYKSFCMPSLDFYESSAYDGALQIHQKLTMNALSLFIIKRFD